MNANTLRAILLSASLTRNVTLSAKSRLAKVGTYLSPKCFSNTSGPRSRVEALRPERFGYMVDVDNFAAL